MAEAKLLCVGLDVSSRSLEVGFCDGSSTPIGRAHSFPNDAVGAAALCEAVVTAARTMGRGTQVIAAVESTSEYHRVASAAARQYNPAIRHFYARLRDRGKSKKAAGGAIARKMAEIVWAVLTSKQPWSEEIALRGIARGEAMAQTPKGERRLTGVAAGQAPTESERPLKAASRSRAPRRDSTIRAGRSKSHSQPI
jgi:hypothetical protein